jgi:hypothetical protein
MSVAQVEVRPLPVTRWHGKKNKESFARPKAVEVLYDPKTGRYATGLTEEEEEKYSKIMGVSLSDIFNANEPHPYFSTKPATIMLENRTMIFNPTIPADYVKIKNMKASKLVANSMLEWEQGKWPEATHVIFDESEENHTKATKVQLKQEAYAFLPKMTDDDKAAIVQILSERTVRGRSTDFLNVEVDAIITEKTDDFLRYMKMGRQEVGLRAKEGSSIFYMGDHLAVDYEGAVEWFRDPNNQKLKISIMEKLTKK